MGEPWSDIAALLRRQKLLAPQSLVPRLLGLDNPREVIQAANALNLSGGMLTSEMLDSMVAHTSDQSTSPARASIVAQPAEDLARTVAPILEPQPIDIQFRNNLPDWNQSDFSMHCLLYTSPSPRD